MPHIKFHKKIHWIFNFGPIDGYAIAYGPRSSSLKIESVRAIHSGKYTCAGSYLINANKRSEFTSSARLIVIGKLFKYIHFFYFNMTIVI